MAHYLCKASKKSRINGFSSRILCTPLTVGLGASRGLWSGSGSPSSLASRFLLVDELMEAGESGRDNEATPLTCAVARPGEAMPGGGGPAMRAPRRAVGFWEPVGGVRSGMGWWCSSSRVCRADSRSRREVARGLVPAPKNFVVGSWVDSDWGNHPTQTKRMVRQIRN
jgi:hypothetical protein